MSDYRVKKHSVAERSGLKLGLFVCVAIPLFAAGLFGQGKTVSAPSLLDSQTSKVDRLVREKMGERHIPGLSLAVVKDSRLVLAKGYGLAELENSVPATGHTAFQIASITKSFTAMAVMMLVEDRKLSLDDPLSKHFDEIPASWRAVTIRHLLNHTSGIKSFTDNETIPCPVGKSVRDYVRGDAWKEVACVPLEFAPGEKWKYGDTGYYLLGMLIEKITGKRYEEFLGERLFRPLEMTDTRGTSYTELIPRRAHGYSWRGGSHRNAPRFDLDEFSNGGLVSTVLDMAKLHTAFTTERVLRWSSLDQLWTDTQLNGGEASTAYGLGFGLSPYKGRRRIGHNGGGGMGFATALTHFPEEKLTVVFLANADQPAGTIGDFANEVAELYFDKVRK